MLKRKTAGLYLASAAIPCCIYLIVLMLLKSVPFGTDSIIISDAANQYIDFASYWKTVLTGENDLFYTFSKTLGGDMLNLAAYYLLSPFNLLFLFAAPETVPAVYTAVMVLKVGMCGLTFFHASSRFYGCRASHLLFSSCYALMAYNVMYVWNTMWLDGPLVLPLLVLGLWRLMKEKSPWLYILSLAYSLATNFYIGYMLCIFSVISFLAMVFLAGGSRKEQLARLGRFSAASLIGGLSTAAVWLPTFLSISGDRYESKGFSLSLEFYRIYFCFPPKFLCGSASAREIASSAPHVFCGTVILLLVVAFFLCGKNSRRLKLAAGATLLIFLVSFVFATPNMVWHGFSPTNSFNYRYAFLFSFVLILIAQYQFSRKDALSSRGVVISAVLLGLFFCLSFLRIMPFLHWSGVLVSFCLLALCTGYFLLREKASLRITAVFCLLCLFELGTNCLISLDAITDSDTMLEAETYTRTVQDTQAAVDYVKEVDSGFYRMEKTFFRSNNDASMHHYNGLSHFSSTEPVFVKAFMRKMGYVSHYNHWASYTDGSTAAADSLLGVKYLLTREDLPKTQNWELLQEQNGIRIFRNPSALPMAVLSQPEIASVTMEEQDLFHLQNKIWQTMTGGSSPLLQEADYRTSIENLTVTENEDASITYTRAEPGRDAFVRYEIPVTREMPLYFHIPEFQRYAADIYINGQLTGIWYEDVTWNMECAGTFAAGETVTVELRITEENMTIFPPYFCYEDASVLAEMAQRVNAQDLQLTRLGSSRFRGSFTAESDQLLMFTIPFNSGWQLAVDGETVPCERVLDCFLSARVTPGSHTFTLRYIPRGFVPGAALSGAAILCAALWLWLRKQKQPE